MSKKLQSLFREKITQGELPVLFANPRSASEEEDSSVSLVKTIEIETYQTSNHWGYKGMKKKICKMLKKKE